MLPQQCIFSERHYVSRNTTLKTDILNTAWLLHTRFLACNGESLRNKNTSKDHFRTLAGQHSAMKVCCQGLQYAM